MRDFIKHSDSSRLFYLEGVSSEDFVGYYVIDGPASITGAATGTRLAVTNTWEGCIGYYIFLRRRPDATERGTLSGALDTLFADVEQPGNMYAIEHSSFLWLDSLTPNSHVGLVKTKKATEGGGNGGGGDWWEYIDAAGFYWPLEEVIALEEAPDVPVMFDFGGYHLVIGKSMRVMLGKVNDHDFCFAFVRPDEPQPICPADATPATSDPSMALWLWLSGSGSGEFEGRGMLGDLFSTCNTSWNVGLQYAANVGGVETTQFYPIFDIRDKRMPLVTMWWDPLDHLNPERTYLALERASVRMECAGPGDCNYRLVIPQAPHLLPTYFRTVTGEIIAFSAVDCAQYPSKFVFERATPSSATNHCYYLVPYGEFELTLIQFQRAAGPPDVPENERDQHPVPLTLDDMEMPSRFLCGLSGVESVEFIPAVGNAEGDRIVFFPGNPAFAPEYPIITATLDLGPYGEGDIDLTLLTSRYVTAWASISSSGRYYAQPEDAPLFKPQSGPMLQLHEPVAANLPVPAADTCFPIAPPAGATPTTIPTAYRAEFLRRFEGEILAPWRRDLIREMMGENNSPQGGLAVSAATLQGLIASINAGPWTTLTLAKNTAGTDLRFSGVNPTPKLNPTLQAAFQTNRMFIVGTLPDYLHGNNTTFISNVVMSDWTFKLKIDENNFGPFTPDDDGDFRDLNNTVIFKFSPGAIIDRVRSPKSWTNAPAFDRYGLEHLIGLSYRLAEFIDYAERRGAETGHPAYTRFMQIVRDKDWNGVLALNVGIDDEGMPAELRALKAGVDIHRFVAHHIAVEASSVGVNLQNQQLFTGDCSTYALIDYVRPKPTGVDPALANDFHFAVKEFRVWFDNGNLREFVCNAQLSINRLFDEVVRSATGPTGNTSSNAIEMTGRRETRGGKPGYAFDLEGGKRFELASKAINTVEIRKAEFAVNEQKNEGTGTSTMRCTFALHGAIIFHKLGASAPGVTPAVDGFDMLSFNPLVFEGFAVDMTFTLNPLTAPVLLPSVARMAFDLAPGSSMLREGSLIRKFPMKLHTLIRSSNNGFPSAQGYVLVGISERFEAIVPAVWYALECELNLGTLGEFAANAGLAVKMLLSWSPGNTAVQAQLWLKFPGVGGAANDLFGLQGVVKFGARNYEMKKFGTGTGASYLLSLNNFALRVLGISFPTGGGPSVFIFGNPNGATPPAIEGQPNTQDDKLGWLGVYRKQTPPAP